MKKIILFVCFTSCLQLLVAQNYYTLRKKVVYEIGISNNGANDILLQPDGKQVVSGYIQEGTVFKPALFRYLVNGRPDPTFGMNGVDSFTIKRLVPAQYQFLTLKALALLPDGKILVAGTAGFFNGFSVPSDAVVLRFNSNGTIDSSFGTSGRVITSVGGTSSNSSDRINDMALQPDGKIVITGETWDLVRHRFLTIRYNSNGTVDNGFGFAGIVTATPGISDDEAQSVIIQPDNKIVIAGDSYSNDGSSYRISLMRLLSDGNTDNSFGINGYTITNLSAGSDGATDAALQTDGRIVISGSMFSVAQNTTDAVCIRYLANGRMDSSFAVNGRYTLDIAGKEDNFKRIQIIPGNKIVLTGNGTNAAAEFLSARLLQNGSPDNDYSSNGWQTNNLLADADVCSAQTISGNGDLLLCGQSKDAASSFISILRLNNNGTQVSTYGQNGVSYTGIGISDDGAYEIRQLPWDNNLLVSGVANAYWTLMKINRVTLEKETSFGINGTVSLKYLTPYVTDGHAYTAIDAVRQKIYIAGFTIDNALTIVRLNKNGQRDLSFGDSGVVAYPFSLFYGCFELQKDGKIILGGVRQEGTNGYHFAARLLANGNIDRSFGTNGEIRQLPIVPMSAAAKRNNDDILIGGLISNGFSGNMGALALNSNGKIDSSFGTNGLASGVNNNAQIFFRYNITQDDKNRIYISGGVQGSNFKYWHGITRFTTGGFLDNSFANKGSFQKDINGNNYNNSWNEGISAYCQGNDCAVLSAGIRKDDFSEKSTGVAILLKENGRIDSLNNSKGYIDQPVFNSEYEYYNGALIDTFIRNRNVFYVAGSSGTATNGDFMVLQFIKPLPQNMVTAKPATIVVEKAVIITPNPAKDFIQIRLSSAEENIISIRIINQSGINILQYLSKETDGKSSLRLALPPGITPGIYYVMIETKNKIIKEKLIIAE